MIVDISVIVPIFKGNKYIPTILGMMNRNVDSLNKNKLETTLELIIVNDSPEEKIIIPNCDTKYKIVVIDNAENEGIHKSRVNGLNCSNGKYVLFLDQDDIIEDSCLASQYEHIGGADVVIGNGYKMLGHKKKLIYKNRSKQRMATNKFIYLNAANQIVSPGHCLIKKDSIPEEWKRYIVKENGGDDMFLWLLMLEKGKVFATNEEIVYTHRDTGVNVSNDMDVMLKSAENVIMVSRQCGAISEQSIEQYNKRIQFQKRLASNVTIEKIWGCLTNLHICLIKLYAYYR